MQRTHTRSSAVAGAPAAGTATPPSAVAGAPAPRRIALLKQARPNTRTDTRTHQKPHARSRPNVYLKPIILAQELMNTHQALGIRRPKRSTRMVCATVARARIAPPPPEIAVRKPYTGQHIVPWLAAQVPSVPKLEHRCTRTDIHRACIPSLQVHHEVHAKCNDRREHVVAACRVHNCMCAIDGAHGAYLRPP